MFFLHTELRPVTVIACRVICGHDFNNFCWPRYCPLCLHASLFTSKWTSSTFWPFALLCPAISCLCVVCAHVLICTKQDCQHLQCIKRAATADQLGHSASRHNRQTMIQSHWWRSYGVLNTCGYLAVVGPCERRRWLSVRHWCSM